MYTATVILLLFFVQFKVPAQPTGIHLSWNGKKAVNTAGSMAITWMSGQPGMSEVLYGTDSLHLDKKASGVTSYVTGINSHITKVTLHGLKPATVYFYKAGSAKEGWSSIYQFRTGPGAGDKSKIVVGIWSDTQNNTGNLAFERTDSMVKLIGRHAYHFTLHTGDMVENGSVPESWKELFNVTQPINARFPFMPAAGNHDVVNDTASPTFQKPFPIFYQFLNLPDNQLNYSYNYGNVHFIAINSGWAEGAARVGKVLFDDTSEEYRWLENDLKKARKNKNINWIILYSHYPVYSFGFSHIPAWQQHLKPLVDKYKVDLYLAGHRHVYERHKAIRGSQVFDLEDTHFYNRPQGTVYVTNGSCGGSLTGTGGQNGPTMVFTPAEKMYTYAVMTIEGNRLQYQVYNQHSAKIDHFTILKE